MGNRFAMPTIISGPISIGVGFAAFFLVTALQGQIDQSMGTIFDPQTPIAVGVTLAVAWLSVKLIDRFLQRDDNFLEQIRADRKELADSMATQVVDIKVDITRLEQQLVGLGETISSTDKTMIDNSAALREVAQSIERLRYSVERSDDEERPRG